MDPKFFIILQKIDDDALNTLFDHTRDLRRRDMSAYKDKRRIAGQRHPRAPAQPGGASPLSATLQTPFEPRF